LPQSLKSETLNKTNPTAWTGCTNSTIGFIVTNTHNRLAAEHTFEARQLAANQSSITVQVQEFGATQGNSAVKIFSTLFSAAMMACALFF